MYITREDSAQQHPGWSYETHATTKPLATIGADSTHTGLPTSRLASADTVSRSVRRWFESESARAVVLRGRWRHRRLGRRRLYLLVPSNVQELVFSRVGRDLLRVRVDICDGQRRFVGDDTELSAVVCDRSVESGFTGQTKAPVLPIPVQTSSTTRRFFRTVS